MLKRDLFMLSFACFCFKYVTTGFVSMPANVTVSRGDIFRTDLNCKLFGAEKYLRPSDRQCICKAGNLSNPNMLSYGTLVASPYGLVYCQYTTEVFGGRQLLSLGALDKIALLTASKRDKFQLYYAGIPVRQKVGTYSVVIVKIKGHTFDVKEPFILANKTLFAVRKDNITGGKESFYLQWNVDPTLYIGKIFQIYLKVRSRTENKTVISGMVIVKVPGSRKYNLVLHKSQLREDDSEEDGREYKALTFIFLVLFIITLAVVGFIIFRKMKDKWQITKCDSTGSTTIANSFASPQRQEEDEKPKNNNDTSPGSDQNPVSNNLSYEPLTKEAGEDYLNCYEDLDTARDERDALPPELGLYEITMEDIKKIQKENGDVLYENMTKQA